VPEDFDWTAAADESVKPVAMVLLIGTVLGLS
jgi:hypothetical protein